MIHQNPKNHPSISTVRHCKFYPKSLFCHSCGAQRFMIGLKTIIANNMCIAHVWSGFNVLLIKIAISLAQVIYKYDIHV